MNKPAGRLAKHLAERLLLFIAEDPVGRQSGKNRSFRRSLRNAVKGLTFAFLAERNFRAECLMFVGAIVLSAVLRIGPIEWLLVVQSGFLVLALEAKNTATELSVDLSTTEYHYGAKGSKDAASGAVLLAAANAAVVGLVVFGPRLVSAAGAALRIMGGTP